MICYLLTVLNGEMLGFYRNAEHECAERHHKLKYGSGYNEAHNRAQTRFDGAPWENQF